MRELFHKLLGLPIVASEHGAKVDDLIIYVHYLMVVLFVGWGIFFVYTLYRFNSRRNPKADYQGVRSHMSSYVELGVAVVEAGLLVLFAVPMWAKNVDTFPDPKNAINIKVIAQQFQWNVFYPGPDGAFGKRSPDFVSASNPWGLDKDDPNAKDDLDTPMNVIHVPVGKSVIIELTSKDVIHSFKLNAMRVTQDATPGLRVPTHFTPTKVGVYQINCAQLCGIGHSGMAGGRVFVDTQEDFDKWMASQTNRLLGSAKSYE